MPSEAIAFLSVVTVVGCFALLSPVVRALAERLRPRQESGLGEALQALREDVAQELQQVRRDVAELGERVDFAERLLAKQREAERLAPPRT
jgi:Tfp pilus assembly protein PilO